jgi:hypothetical protein
LVQVQGRRSSPFNTNTYLLAYRSGGRHLNETQRSLDADRSDGRVGGHGKDLIWWRLYVMQERLAGGRKSSRCVAVGSI